MIKFTIAAAFILFISFLGFAKSAPSLKLTPEFILTQVLEYKSVAANPAFKIPEVKFASQVSLKEFQDDVEPQWGVRPDQVSNVYIVKKNVIYLSDDMEYYESRGRCIEDSLAHEFTHYVQVVYQGGNLADDNGDYYEMDAVYAQNWFREKFCSSQQK